MRCDNLSGESEYCVHRYGVCQASLVCQSHVLLHTVIITGCEGLNVSAQKQLFCRILVKVIPHSVSLISSSEEGGGGNRISEDQIKSYLDEALGEGPRPMWGLPGGWGDYCASKSNEQAHDVYINHPTKEWIGSMHCSLHSSATTALHLQQCTSATAKRQALCITFTQYRGLSWY